MTEEEKEEVMRATHEEMMKCQSAFGQFILDFSQAEWCLYLILLAMTRLPDAMARALFSGTRAKSIGQFINAYISNTHPEGEEPPKIKQLQAAIQQLNIIDGTRSQLVHSGIGSFTRNGMVVSNEGRVSRYEHKHTFIISSKEIDDMSFDLSQISGYFHTYAFSLLNPMSCVSMPELPSTWRHKPPQRDSQPSKTRRKPPKQPRPPKPSRA